MDSVDIEIENDRIKNFAVMSVMAQVKLCNTLVAKGRSFQVFRIGPKLTIIRTEDTEYRFMPKRKKK